MCTVPLFPSIQTIKSRMSLFSLNTQLNQAELVLKELEEYKVVQNLKLLIQKEIDELTKASPDLQKEILKELGFECRTGYTIELDPPNLNELYYS